MYLLYGLCIEWCNHGDWVQGGHAREHHGPLPSNTAMVISVWWWIG